MGRDRRALATRPSRLTHGQCSESSKASQYPLAATFVLILAILEELY